MYLYALVATFMHPSRHGDGSTYHESAEQVIMAYQEQLENGFSRVRRGSDHTTTHHRSQRQESDPAPPRGASGMPLAHHEW